MKKMQKAKSKDLTEHKIYTAAKFRYRPEKDKKDEKTDSNNIDTALKN